MEPIHRRVAGLDVHRMKQGITVLIEGEDGSITKHMREFGGFKRDMKALMGWLTECQIERVILESTGIYWKSVFASLSAAGIPAWVVNAHHVKPVPGRKTDVADSEWLAQLGRFGAGSGVVSSPRRTCVSCGWCRVIARRLQTSSPLRRTGGPCSREVLEAALEGELSYLIEACNPMPGPGNCCKLAPAHRLVLKDAINVLQAEFQAS